jgi:trimethylamine--corrinoid protein Co-methyltransferase
MRGAGHEYRVLSVREEETLHANVLRLIDQVGLQVESDPLLERMAAIGGRVDGSRQRVTFSPLATEEFIASSQWVDWDHRPPQVRGSADIYYGLYLDPQSDELLPMTVERARMYYRVAAGLSHIDSMGILGCPLQGIPPYAEPLYERYWAWQMGVRPHGSIHRLSLCSLILEMSQAHASFANRPLSEVLSATVYLVPALKLGYQEADQVLWFLERGLRAHVGGSMATGGATAPVTVAGMVAVSLAENILLGMLHRALYGDRTWNIWMSVTALDARTMMRPYGRPDSVLANLMAAQMARRYGAGLTGHCGLADAVRPSPEATAQKMQSALPTLLAGGNCSIPAGLLAIDQVYSPVQMVLDDQLISALAQFTHQYEVSDEAIATDLVAVMGPGGNYAGEMHTAQWFRRELWEPTVWTRHPLAAWRDLDGRTDLERARERALDILAQPAAPSPMSEDEARALQAIIERAPRN